MHILLKGRRTGLSSAIAVSRKREIHVVRCLGGGYAVKRRGAERASKICMRPGRAIQYAKHLLRKTGGCIYQHGPDGRVMRKLFV